jgi:hypothetical protein
MRFEIRYLAFHPGITILALNMRAHRRHQITHGPYAVIGWLETESKLVGGGHCSGVYNTEVQLLALSSWRLVVGVEHPESKRSAAKRRKNVARGASPGSEWKMALALEGRRNACGTDLQVWEGKAETPKA